MNSCYPGLVFAGLVAAIGTLRDKRATASGARMVIEHDLGRLELGESVSVSGVCLTVVEVGPNWFAADVSRESLTVTCLSGLVGNARVNLERALRVGDRLGGHWVTGHVDGLVTVERLEQHGDSVSARFGVQASLLAYIAPKGSVALDGVSLTVNGVAASTFEVMLIPHTRAMTTLGDLAPGSRHNLEVDVLARYVARRLEFGEHRAAETTANSSALEKALKRSGMI